MKCKTQNFKRALFANQFRFLTTKQIRIISKIRHNQHSKIKKLQQKYVHLQDVQASEHITVVSAVFRPNSGRARNIRSSRPNRDSKSTGVPTRPRLAAANQRLGEVRRRIGYSGLAIVRAGAWYEGCRGRRRLRVDRVLCGLYFVRGLCLGVVGLVFLE